jgi:formamidopyrimidine-DNA glycosylase
VGTVLRGVDGGLRARCWGGLRSISWSDLPELPEVETIRRQLAPLVEGRRLLRVEILDPRWSRPLAPRELADALVGRRVERLQRRGKYLIWRLQGEVFLVQHLRMTGAILCDPRPEPAHLSARLELGAPRGGSRAPIEASYAPQRAALQRAAPQHVVQPDARARGGARVARGVGARRDAPPRRVRLAIADPRRFGTGELLLGEEALERFLAARLGLEPLDERFTAAHLRALARGRTAPIKAFLLDQRRVAGVGNIYADEALFRAGIHPLRSAGRLTLTQSARLREAMIEALCEGVDARGASIDDFRHIDGVRGSFQDRFLVHRRAGLPCPRCGTAIVKLVVGGRGTYVCERCQPRPRGARRGRVTQPAGLPLAGLPTAGPPTAGPPTAGPPPAPRSGARSRRPRASR